MNIYYNKCSLYSKFEKLTKEQIEQGRRIATRPFKRLNKVCLVTVDSEISSKVIYKDGVRGFI